MSIDERTIRVGLALVMARGCILCGGPAELAGMFWPTDSQAWGARPGQQRVCFYALCELCFECSDRLEAVEARLAHGRRRAA